MRAKWPFLGAVLTVALGYAAFPYVTLYRLGSAIQRGDATVLETLVNWPAVREGIKEDVCDLVIDDPSAKGYGDLPPFGASFMRGIASSAIDQAVTPQALVAATTAIPASATLASSGSVPAKEPKGAEVHVNWAFFDGPTTFMVSLQPPGQAEPIRLEMDLRHGSWRVQRVWLPAELLSNSPSKT